MSKIYEILCDDGVCSECQKYAGKFDQMPEHIPPFHPNCKCKMVEVEIEDILEDLFDKLKEYEGYDIKGGHVCSYRSCAGTCRSVGICAG